MSTVVELSKAILRDLLTDFVDRNLSSEDLSDGYVGVPFALLKGKYCAGSTVDFDLAVKDLEAGALVDTGPMVPFDNPPGSTVVLIGIRSRYEYAYLTEKGYKAAQKAQSTKRYTPRRESVYLSGSGKRDSRYDLFLSYASEDKDIARALHAALTAAGVSVWFDEAVLELGDSLRRTIDEGLSKCRFGVVILSPHFFGKSWPQQELNGLSARETATGEKAIIPIWHNLDATILAQYSPTLADRVAGRSEEGLQTLVHKILKVVS